MKLPESNLKNTNKSMDSVNKATAYPSKAISFPIGFAQVREDPLQDEQVIKKYFQRPIKMVMVASGGDSASYLVGKGYLCKLTVVDTNQSQICLTKLKIHLLGYTTEKRLNLLGCGNMPIEDQKKYLEVLMDLLDIPIECFGEVDDMGLFQSGKYEAVFEALRSHLNDYKPYIEQLFELKDIDEQVRMVASTTAFGRALDMAFGEVMSQKNLEKIFGKGATGNRLEDFHIHFVKKTRLYLSRHLASGSPFFAQMFLGRFHNNIHYPWLSLPKTQVGLQLCYIQKTMQAYLKSLKKSKYDVVHLSNILDWLPVGEAKETLSLAYKALKPGGIVLIRQLNSSLDIPKMCNKLDWNLEMGRMLGDQDRSFFYSNFYIGIKSHSLLVPQLTFTADGILKNIDITNNCYFKALKSGKMTLEQFKITQKKFFHAVNYISRPMAMLFSRLPNYRDRVKILDNIVEEHGNFDINKTHASTFKLFLNRLGCNAEDIENQNASIEAELFNQVLMNVAKNEDPLFGVGCIGIVEYAFIFISSQIGKSILEKGWITKGKLIHYNIHAELDKTHAAELFSIAEPHIKDIKVKNKVKKGMELGAYIFSQLYEQLYKNTLS